VSGNPKTPADLLFEEYLMAHGRTDFAYEQRLPGTNRTPDYQLPRDQLPLLFEVKGFDVEVPKGFGVIDPYPPLREKINHASKQFRDVKQYCCSLVLHYAGPGMVFLEPTFIYGAMLGNVGFEMPIDLSGESPVIVNDKNIRQVFTTGGRMVKYGKGGTPLEPRNTTISSIVVVEHYPIGRRRLMRHVQEHERHLRREITSEELWETIDRHNGTERDVSLTAARAVVCENPYARVPLPRDVFVGRFDERYGADEHGRVVRLFAGDAAAEFDPPSL
jgi:hypothetical protein